MLQLSQKSVETTATQYLKVSLLIDICESVNKLPQSRITPSRGSKRRRYEAKWQNKRHIKYHGRTNKEELKQRNRVWTDHRKLLGV